jgi:hypothetical protein
MPAIISPENATAAAQQFFTDTMNQTWVIVLVIIAMFVLILVIMYIMQMIKTSKLTNVVLQKDMLALDNLQIVPLKVEAEQMSIVSNGLEFSYTFWIFLGSSYSATTAHKILIQRGNAAENGEISNGTNPIIMLDSSTNVMYFAASSTAVTTQMNTNDIIKRDGNSYTSGYLVSTIDYVPLQRWVNVAMVIKDKAMNIYMDGDLYSVSTVHDIHTGEPVLVGTHGDLLIGDKKNNTPGYISLTNFYNYALTQNDLKKIYNKGPTPTSWLAWLGIKNYGVRTPIYELGEPQ